MRSVLAQPAGIEQRVRRVPQRTRNKGLHNTSGGAYLLCCEMPHERGGRLHRDPVSGRWMVSPGFENHPAYWVTWIGAAAFAARHSARLPQLDLMNLPERQLPFWLFSRISTSSR
ncbi:hypothetical protein AB0392_07035 [Nonomuraea angiospora]|uniref:hypothetical protein n=1 Tax=Nonomuraea angiospora TaxID=46172 RepID=UPI00344D5772